MSGFFFFPKNYLKRCNIGRWILKLLEDPFIILIDTIVGVSILQQNELKR